MALAFILLVLFSQISLGNDAKNTWIIAAEDGAGPWGRHDGKGCGNDLVKEAYAEVGDQVNLRVVPYPRCKNQVKAGEVVACFGMGLGENETEPFVIFSKDPLYFNFSSLLQRNPNDDMKNIGVAKKLENLQKIPKGTHIAVVNGYEYPKEIQKLTEAGVIFDLVNSESAVVKLLFEDRVKYGILNTDSLKSADYIGKVAGLNIKDFSVAYVAPPSGTYLGFSKKHTSATLAKARFDQGFAKLQKSGRYKKILKQCEVYLK